MPKPMKYPPIQSEDEFWHCIGLHLGDCVIVDNDPASKLRRIERYAALLLAYYRYLQARELGIKTNPRKFTFHNR